jgi:hypothetical protein
MEEAFSSSGKSVWRLRSSNRHMIRSLLIFQVPVERQVILVTGMRGYLTGFMTTACGKDFRLGQFPGQRLNLAQASTMFPLSLE